MITEIVVPVGGGPPHERGLNLAVSLAERLDVALRLIHVDTEAESPENGGDDVVARALEKFRGRHKAMTVTGETVAHEKEANGIAEALDHGSLVVMASSRAGDMTTPVSIAEALVREWAGPVVIVGPNARSPGWSEPVDWTDPVVVPLDGSPAAERAIPLGQSLSESLDVPLWLVHVVDPATSEKVLELRAAGESASESAYLRSVAEAASTQSKPVGWEIVHGDDPVTGVLDFACDNRASLIVATTRGASGIERLNFGSVCMSLVRAGTHAVAVLGPDKTAEAALM